MIPQDNQTAPLLENGFHSKRLDPLAPPITSDFDYEQVDRNLDPLSEAETPDIAHALRAVFQWVTGVDLRKSKIGAMASIGQRLVSALWVLDPGYFEGSPSMQALAKLAGLSRGGMSKAAADFSRAFGIVNRIQAHGRREQ